MPFLSDYQMKTLLLVATLLYLDDRVTALPKPCPAAPPCLCAGTVLHCEAANLTVVPNFDRLHSSIDTLKLSTNYISSISAAAFDSLNLIRLFLDHNSIETVHESAFAGIGDSLKELHLEHNRLHTMPPALRGLNAVTRLDVSNNPIQGDTGFSDDVMRDIGDTVTYFRFGDITSLKQWPSSLDHLQRLEDLQVTGSNISSLPLSAFHGFEFTLKILTIENANILEIPIAIGQLKTLKELHLDTLGPHIDDLSTEQLPYNGLRDTIVTLSLKNDNLKRFPTFIQYFVNLRNLSLDENKFAYISDESIHLIDSISVNYLSFRNCGLHRVPAAVSDLRHVIYLDLSHNNIRSIESNDLQNARSLQRLNLAYNPVKYISRSAFFRLYSLSYLDLSHTNITVVSAALSRLHHLTEVNLQDCRIDCTCDLFWMRTWMDVVDRNITVYGQCETVESSIQNYLRYRIPSCPDYIAG